MTELLTFLNSIHSLTAETNEYLTSTLKRIDIFKKDFILKQSHVCFNIYFVSKGLVRCFYIRDDKEVSSWFMIEGDVIVSVESFFNQTPSYESIQALEDCTLYYISYNELQFAYNNFPEFNFVGGY